MTDTVSSALNPGSSRVTLCHTLKGHTSEILSVAWSPDGTRLASGSADGMMRLWDGSNGRLLHTLEGKIGLVAWSPDGTRLLSWAADSPIRLWDGSGVTRLHELDVKPHGDYIQWVEWSPDGTRFASASAEGTVCLWDGSDGKLVCVLEDTAPVFWLPDGAKLASSCSDWTGLASLWADEKGLRRRTVRQWDGSNGKPLQILLRRTDARSLAWSPDGMRLATCSGGRKVRLWDSSSGKLLHTLKGHTGAVWLLAWSPDGTRLASGSADRTLRLWDSSSGKLLHTLEGHTNEIRLLKWSSNGLWLASSARSRDYHINDTEVRIWQTSTWQCVAILKVRSRWATCAWHPSLPLLATPAEASGDICLWQLGVDGQFQMA